jgi:hypothetical protein
MVNSLSDSVLRISPLAKAGISGNPFYDAVNPSSPRPKVWAPQLRKPFRLSLKPGAGRTVPAMAGSGCCCPGL